MQCGICFDAYEVCPLKKPFYVRSPRAERNAVDRAPIRCLVQRHILPAGAVGKTISAAGGNELGRYVQLRVVNDVDATFRRKDLSKQSCLSSLSALIFLHFGER